ncbi:hypothetical protein P7C70_g1304, partial [Phenoliferia sp. Uapishka_3]
MHFTTATTSRSSLGARLSPSEEKPRNHSSASNLSTGTPRSRAAAKEAELASTGSAGVERPGPSTPTKKPVASVKIPLTPRTPTARVVATSPPTMPKTTPTPTTGKPVASRTPAARGSPSPRGQSTSSRGRGGGNTARRRSSLGTTPAVSPSVPMVVTDGPEGEVEDARQPETPFAEAIEEPGSAAPNLADAPKTQDEDGESPETIGSTKADSVLSGEEEQSDDFHPHSMDLSDSLNVPDVTTEGYN